MKTITIKILLTAPTVKAILLILLLNSHLLLFAANSDEQHPEDTVYHYFGVYGHYNYNFHSASFSKLPGVPNCCPLFESSAGTGFSAGLLFEYNIAPKMSITTRAGFSKLGGEFTQYENTLVKIGYDVTEGEFKHVITADLTAITFEPMFDYNVFDKIYLHGAFTLGFWMQSVYEQYEQITKPENIGVFVETQQRLRNQSSGDINDMNPVYFGLSAGISYRLPLDDKGEWFLSPEFFYTAGMLDNVKDIVWSVSPLKLGLALRYTPIPDPPEPEQINLFRYIIDTVESRLDYIVRDYVVPGDTVQLHIVERTKDTISNITVIERTDTMFLGKRPIVKIDSDIKDLFVNTQLVHEKFPVLPVVFFKEGTAEIEDYYELLDTNDIFNSENLIPNQLIYHQNILNIIGERLRRFSDAKISLQGYTDKTTEDSNCELALARSLSIKNYLQNIWKIDSGRIAVVEKSENCNTEEKTRTPNDSGYSENRRVRIKSDDLRILGPISQRSFLEVTDYSPKQVSFDPAGTTKDAVAEWTLRAIHMDKVMYEERGFGPPEEIIFNISRHDAVSLSRKGEITLELVLKDTVGNIARGSNNIEIDADTASIEKLRISLVLFGVSKDEIREDTKQYLSEFIKEIEEDSKVIITGYSDILGDSKINNRLSLKRAESAAELLRDINKNIKIDSISGVGDTKLPPGIFSYATAPERFLCRTVQIEILRYRGSAKSENKDDAKSGNKSNKKSENKDGKKSEAEEK